MYIYTDIKSIDKTRNCFDLCSSNSYYVEQDLKFIINNQPSNAYMYIRS